MRQYDICLLGNNKWTVFRKAPSNRSCSNGAVLVFEHKEMAVALAEELEEAYKSGRSDMARELRALLEVK